MTDNQPFKHIKFENTRESYAGMTAALAPALRTTIETLAKLHDNKYGAWFDELERQLINNAKGTIAEGFDITTETKFIGLGVQIVQATLDAVRSNLIRE